MTALPKQKNPAEILELQLQALTEIANSHNVQLEIIKNQNNKLSALLNVVDEFHHENDLIHVKVENINMPFLSLVGFLVKFSIASIPATLILALIFFLLFVIFGGFLGVISSLIRI